MSDYTTAVKYAMFFFMALMLIEWIASKILNKKVYQISDTISSISSGMTNNIKSILNLSIVIISYHWMFESFAIFQISSSWWVYVCTCSCVLVRACVCSCVPVCACVCLWFGCASLRSAAPV